MNTNSGNLQCPAPKEVRTRFIYPFFVKRNCLKEVAEALLNAQTTWGEGENQQKRWLWSPADPSDFYRDEMLDHCLEFLFLGHETKNYRYFQLDADVTNRWFGRAQVALPQQVQRWPVSDAEVELFLSHAGFGVLSVALRLLPRPGETTLSPENVLNFNYCLTQLSQESKRSDSKLNRQRSNQPDDLLLLLHNSAVTAQASSQVSAQQAVQTSPQANAPKNAHPTINLLRNRLKPETLKRLDEWRPGTAPPSKLLDHVLEELTAVLHGPCLYDDAALHAFFGDHTPQSQNWPSEANLRLNQMLLEETFPGIIRRSRGVDLHLAHSLEQLSENSKIVTPKSDKRRDNKGAIPLPPNPLLPPLNRLGYKGCSFTLADLIINPVLLAPSNITNVAGLLHALSNKKDALSTQLRDRFPGLNSWLEKYQDTPDTAPVGELVKQLNHILRAGKPLCNTEYLPENLSDAARNEFKQHLARRPRGDEQVALNRRLLEALYPYFAPYEGESLLSPFQSFGLMRVQDQFSIYTVVLFDESVDFEQPDMRLVLGPFLSRLAQVEEPAHAGAVSDEMPMAHTLLNRRHWAAVGLLGAAHLVADQPQIEPGKPLAFNTERVSRVFCKYFMPYLIAFMQQLTLHKILDETGDIVSAARYNAEENEEKLEQRTQVAERLIVEQTSHLWRQLLEFEVNGYFPQISTREALHRYYKLCQIGLDVPRSLETVRRPFADLDAKRAELETATMQSQLAELAKSAKESAKIVADAQPALENLAEGATKHVHEVAQVQTKLETLEVLIASVYAAELFHLGMPPSWEHDPILKAGVALIGASVGCFIGLLVLKPKMDRRFVTGGRKMVLANF